MEVYVDNENKCHVSPTEGSRACKVPFFDGKCNVFIEGYKYFPESGMLTRWGDSTTLEKAQLEYELAQYEAALAAIETALGVTSE